MVEAGATPEWWGAAKEVISASDVLLKDVIEDFEEPSLSSRGNLFATLIKSIVGQQISVIAASAVWSRFCECVGEVNEELGAGQCKCYLSSHYYGRMYFQLMILD